MADEFKRVRSLIGNTSDWASNDIVIGLGEMALEVDVTGKVFGKVGDGIQTFSQLGYAFSSDDIPLSGTKVGEPVTGLIEFEAATTNGPVTLAQVDNALGATQDAMIWDATGASDTSFVFRMRNSGTGAIQAFAFTSNGEFIIPSESAVDGGSWHCEAATILGVPNTLIWQAQDYLGAQTSHVFAITTAPNIVFTFNTDGTFKLGRGTLEADDDLSAASKGYVDAKTFQPAVSTSFGEIQDDGTINGGTGDFSVTYNAGSPGEYGITFNTAAVSVFDQSLTANVVTTATSNLNVSVLMIDATGIVVFVADAAGAGFDHPITFTRLAKLP